MDEPNSNVIISAFTEKQVERLTGVTVHQLRRWDRTGFYHPQFADENRRNPYSRIYSFRDIVSLQILNALKNDLGMSLQHLRKVKDKLDHLGDDKWSKTRLYVVKKEVVFYDDAMSEKRHVLTGQIVIDPIIIEVVKSRMADAVRNLRYRDETKIGTIEKHRRVAQNSWVIGGTRIPVRAIKEFSQAGYSIDQILKEYPTITREDIAAALAHGKAA